MSTREPSTFGALIRRHRVAAQLTQKQLAERVNLTASAIAALEHGARLPPSTATVEALADALNLSPAERTNFRAAAGSLSADPVAVAIADGQAPRESKHLGDRQRRHMAWMPLQPTPLVGRSQEVETILRMLSVDGVRLLTIIGPAGVGKTRLALAAVQDLLAKFFPDGVIFVDLTPIRLPQDVLGAIARACGVTDTSPFPVGERLIASLQGRATLVVLDNFEQVLPAAADLADLLGQCPNLALLVTSRAPLHVRWEQTLRVAPLPVPDLSSALPPLAELASIPSVMLFLQRARARRASFALTDKQTPMLAALVAQLDGLPLALELAAARLDVLSLSTLTRRLADRMQLLSVGAPDVPERQQSLEAAVGWSYDLLSESEQRIFRCLGVFVGRVTLDAIAAVDNEVRGETAESVEGDARDGKETGDTFQLLLSLAEKSLLLPMRPEGLSGLAASTIAPEGQENEPEDEPEPAFGMLETVREYAWERLAAPGELAAAQEAHAHFFLALAERADQELRGPEQRAWCLRLEREQDNLRAALRWLFDQDDETERVAGLRLAGALGWFWAMFGYHAEGERWLRKALTRAPQGLLLRIRALIPLGMILASRGEIGRVQEALQEALTLAEGQDPSAAAMARIPLGHAVIMAGKSEEGNRLIEEALRIWTTRGDLWGVGLTHCTLGLVADMAGDAMAAVAHYTDGVRELETAGDAHQAAYYHGFLGVNAWKLGDLHRAVAHVRAGLRTSIDFQDRWLLSMAAQATLALGWAHTQAHMRARLLGAADALTQTRGAAFPGEPGGHEVVALRERLVQPGDREDLGLAAAYRDGRTLSFDAVATMSLRLLEEAAQSLSRPELSEKAGQRATHAGEQAAAHASETPLTAREVEVLRLVAQGLSSKLVARELSIAPGTVNYHLARVFNKLGVDTRAQAVAVATQRGLL
jgi:predicted ATPase/DNA-binding CsgD family transcriptional regulator/transcriptional regulator with XRE-family HTH domain